MQATRSHWQGWAQWLHRWKLADLVAILLDAAGPLMILFAQLVYFGQPFMAKATPTGQLQALAHMLEDHEESLSFVAYLREEVGR